MTSYFSFFFGPDQYNISIPNIPHFFRPMYMFAAREEAAQAVMLHNFLYMEKGKVDCFARGPFERLFGNAKFEYSRADADKIYYDALREANIKPWLALLAYWNARICGAFYWKGE